MSVDIALIGAGYWGKNIARNLHELGVLRMICDASEDLLKGYAGSYPNVALTTDSDEVLGNPDIKAVFIAAPASQHAVLARQALLVGKDVFVEKPLALDLNDARELVELAREGGRVLMVGHLLHYHPHVQRLMQLAGGGELGKIRYVTSHRLNLGKIRVEENALWSFAPHDFSVILALAGEKPDHVRCTGESHLTHGVADTTLTTMRFPGGMRAHVYVSWLNPFKEQRLTVVGERALAVFDDTRPWPEKLAVYPQPVHFDADHVPHACAVTPKFIEVPEGEPLRNECEHFLASCAHRATPRTDGEEGMRVLELLTAAQASLERDGEATVPGEGLASLWQAHPTAVVDPGARIGAKTRIWHFSHIMGNCDIGEGCSLGQNCFVASGVKLGHNVKVQNNVSIYTGVVCEDDVFLGPSMVFTNVINPRSAVPRRDEYQPTLLKRGVSVGANATIVCGTTIGEHAFIGAGATVTKDVPAYALIVGTPGRVVGWMSAHGERLSLAADAPIGTRATCPASGITYELDANGLTECDA